MIDESGYDSEGLFRVETKWAGWGEGRGAGVGGLVDVCARPLIAVVAQRQCTVRDEFAYVYKKYMQKLAHTYSYLHIYVCVSQRAYSHAHTFRHTHVHNYVQP